MWSDNAADVDLLGYEDLLGEIVTLAIDPTLQPLTIGAFADWGAGKSTLLQLAAAELRKHDVLVVEFSPWLVEGYDDVKSCLLGAVLDEIEVNQDPSLPSTPEKVKKLLRGLRSRVDWLRLAKLGATSVVPFAGIAIGTLDSVLRPPEKEEVESATVASSAAVTRGFHREFEELIASVEDFRSVVVLIDDLDRCLPDQVIETLEAIRLFLATPGTAFVVAADERLVRDAVRRRYAAASEIEIDLPREYLEKLIQVPLRIPPLARPDGESYCNLLVAEKLLDSAQFGLLLDAARSIRASGELRVNCNIGIVREALEGHAVPDELEAELALMEQLVGPLTSGLKGNPRQIKRYLNTLDLRRRTARRRGIDVDEAVLAKLVVLEYVRDDRYRTLHTWQQAGGGVSEELRRLEQAVAEGDHSIGSEPDIGSWAADAWTVDWLKVQPALSGVDLTQYFFLSRDRVSNPGTLSRLSPALQALMANLESDVASIREPAIDDAKLLGIEDQLLVVDASASRLHSLTDKHGLMMSIIELAESQLALVPSATAGLASVAYSEVPADIPLVIAGRLSAAAVAEPVGALLKTWETQTVSGPLSKAALKARTSLEGKSGNV